MNEAQMRKIAQEMERRKQNRTKEEALKNLQKIGVLDKNGNVTPPYKGVFVKSDE
jgi:hypothetical protein